MRLSEYKSVFELSERQLERMLGVSHTTINRIINDSYYPTKEVINKIKDKTNGLVTENDYPKYERKYCKTCGKITPRMKR